jgi:pSer/pThr/pTyr-binding forkhead associated (FHA) protein
LVRLALGPDERLDSPVTPHTASPAELSQRIEAERRGRPFVLLRDGQGRQRIVELDEHGPQTIGRSEEAEVRIDWDAQVSSAHVELRRLAGDWVVVDDGMSRNGTFVNEERVVARRRLRDGDQVRVGRTLLVFREPQRRRVTTFVPRQAGHGPELTPAQKRVLVALCRPFQDGGDFARPASNQQIADALTLTVAAVKTHLRTLFVRFGVADLPQNEKRARLVQIAFEEGVLSPVDLDTQR